MQLRNGNRRLKDCEKERSARPQFMGDVRWSWHELNASTTPFGQLTRAEETLSTRFRFWELSTEIGSLRKSSKIKTTSRSSKSADIILFFVRQMRAITTIKVGETALTYWALSTHSSIICHVKQGDLLDAQTSTSLRSGLRYINDTFGNTTEPEGTKTNGIVTKINLCCRNIFLTVSALSVKNGETVSRPQLSAYWLKGGLRWDRCDAQRAIASASYLMYSFSYSTILKGETFSGTLRPTELTQI